MTFINFSTTNNSISNKVTYDEKTGGRITRPENINGNWNVMGAFMFNCSIDSAGVWNLNTDTYLGYNNYVSYLSLDKQSDSQEEYHPQYYLERAPLFQLSQQLAGAFARWNIEL